MQQGPATNTYRLNYEKFVSIAKRNNKFSYIEDYIYDYTIVGAVTAFNSSKISGSFFEFYSDYLDRFSNSRGFSSLELLQASIKKKKKKWSGILNVDEGYIKFLGDYHKNITKVTEGHNVYYENVLGYESFLHNLSKILPDFKNFYPEYSINKNYVSREFIRKDSGKQNSLYYYNFGRLISWALFFRVIDLNYENILIKENIYPYVYDLEFLLTPKTVNFDFDLKMTGLLSGQGINNNTALFGGLYPINSLLKPLIEFNNDKPYIVWQRNSNKEILNQFSSDQKHPYYFIDNIQKGLNDGFSVIEKHKNLILDLLEESNFSTRVLIRPTRVYRASLMNTIYSTESSYKSHQDFLGGVPIIEYEMNPYKALFKSEIRSLTNFEIPYFYVNIHNKLIKDADGFTVGKLSEKPFETFCFHINSNFEKFCTKQKASVSKLCKYNYSKHFANSN